MHPPSRHHRPVSHVPSLSRVPTPVHHPPSFSPAHPSSAHDAWSSLSSAYTVITPTSTSRDSFLTECASGAFSTCTAAYRTFGSLSLTGPLDSTLVAALPASLRVICHHGAGYDHFTSHGALPLLSARGILLTNVPDATADATADTALFLMLGALRNFNPAMLSLRRSPAAQWRGTPPPAYGHDPKGKVIGILGLGGIGRAMARRCKALGMSIIYHSRHRVSPALEASAGGARYVSFEELLSSSDVISVHVPLNAATRHLLGRRELALCKKGVVIVNTARGGVIDEAALVDALESGRVGNVGLDVFEEEPKVHEGLLKNERAVLLPHCGTWTSETMAEMEIETMRNVRCAIEWATGSKEAGCRLSVVPEQRALLEEMLAE